VTLNAYNRGAIRHPNAAFSVSGFVTLVESLSLALAVFAKRASGYH
jgi:hypothetical protein